MSANSEDRKKRRKPKPATAARLEKAALAHIDRYQPVEKGAIDRVSLDGET